MNIQENNGSGRQLFFKWLAVFLFILAFHIVVIKKLNRQQPIHHEKLPQLKKTKIARVWVGNSDNLHIVFQPYFFDPQRSKFNDQVLNDALKQNRLTYYKLWLINFKLPTVNFTDSRDGVVIVDQNGRSRGNVPIFELIGENTVDCHAFLRSLTQPAVVPAGHIKAFLLAMPNSINLSKIKAVRVTLSEKTYELSLLFCLPKDFYAYLQQPNASFWKDNNKR